MDSLLQRSRDNYRRSVAQAGGLAFMSLKEATTDRAALVVPTVLPCIPLTHKRLARQPAWSVAYPAESVRSDSRFCVIPLKVSPACAPDIASLPRLPFASAFSSIF